MTTNQEHEAASGRGTADIATLVERLRTQAGEAGVGGFWRTEELLHEAASALEAQGRGEEVTYTSEWRCAQCGCHTYARVDEKKADGKYGPGPQVRCVHCKDVTTFPVYRHPAPLPPAQGEDQAAAVKFYAENPSAALCDFRRRTAPAQDEGLETNLEEIALVKDRVGSMVEGDRVWRICVSLERLLSRRPPAAEGSEEPRDQAAFVAEKERLTLQAANAIERTNWTDAPLTDDEKGLIGMAVGFMLDRATPPADRDAVIKKTEQQIVSGLRRAAANWAGEPLRFSREEVFRDAAFHVERGDFRAKPVEAGEAKS